MEASKDPAREGHCVGAGLRLNGGPEWGPH